MTNAEWVSMKHESPDDGEQVLILTKYRDIYVGKYLMAEGLFKLNTCGTVKVKRVTHWMKLPAMPKGEPDDET